MIEILFPKIMIDKVQDIDLNMLKKRSIKGLILDIDNTLVPNHAKDADEKVISWIERVKREGFKVCIVSNASRKRVVVFNEKLKLFAIHKAGKPGIKSFMKAVRLMGIEPEETAVVGDQIFTDVFGGNRSKMFTILVKPIDKREVLHVRLKRLPEKIVLSKYKKYNRNLSDKESI